MKKVTVKVETPEEFLKRGRNIARRADRGEPLAEEMTISFEDTTDMLALLTPKRIEVFREVKVKPGLLTDISLRLKRDRSAVKRDVDALARAGLVVVSIKKLPGHGLMKEVRASARRIKVLAEVA
jgi:predicted transcriptional regulator